MNSKQRTATKPEIIFQNEHVVAVDKAHGVLTVPSRMGKADPRSCLGIELQEHLKKRIFPVHRLDFEVSGIVLFALSDSAQRTLSDALENRAIEKTYQALSSLKSGETPEFSVMQTWECKLVRGKKRAFEADYGKPSLTLATCLGTTSSENQLRWLLQPKTGRSHQLRYEMYRHGFPILGDKLYGSLEGYESDAIALRAIKLEFDKYKGAGSLKLPAFLEVPPLFQN